MRACRRGRAPLHELAEQVAAAEEGEGGPQRRSQTDDARTQPAPRQRAREQRQDGRHRQRQGCRRQVGQEEDEQRQQQVLLDLGLPDGEVIADIIPVDGAMQAQSVEAGDGQDRHGRQCPAGPGGPPVGNGVVGRFLAETLSIRWRCHCHAFLLSAIVVGNDKAECSPNAHAFGYNNRLNGKVAECVSIRQARPPNPHRMLTHSATRTSALSLLVLRMRESDILIHVPVSDASQKRRGGCRRFCEASLTRHHQPDRVSGNQILRFCPIKKESRLDLERLPPCLRDSKGVGVGEVRRRDQRPGTDSFQ